MDTLTESQWDLLTKRHGKGEEFDWFARDKLGYLAFFTSAGIGPIPNVIWEHLSEYNGLVKFLTLLPCRGFARVFNRSGNYAEWQDVADRGLHAFDYYDVHRVTKLGGYDLIARPAAPVACHDLPHELVRWLPVLDVQFSAIAFLANGVVVPTSGCRES